MSAISRFFANTFQPARDVGPTNVLMVSVAARRRFANSMPAEIGSCAATRLFGIGR